MGDLSYVPMFPGITLISIGLPIIRHLFETLPKQTVSGTAAHCYLGWDLIQCVQAEAIQIVSAHMYTDVGRTDVRALLGEGYFISGFELALLIPFRTSFFHGLGILQHTFGTLQFHIGHIAVSLFDLFFREMIRETATALGTGCLDLIPFFGHIASTNVWG